MLPLSSSLVNGSIFSLTRVLFLTIAHYNVNVSVVYTQKWQFNMSQQRSSIVNKTSIVLHIIYLERGTIFLCFFLFAIYKNNLKPP